MTFGRKNPQNFMGVLAPDRARSLRLWGLFSKRVGIYPRSMPEIW